MKRLLVLALLLAPLPPAFARSTRVYPGDQAEDRLRRFLDQDAALKARLDQAVQQESALRLQAGESELRDSVAGLSDQQLRDGLESSGAVARRKLISSLPGMAQPEPGACVRLADCATPELAVEAPDAARLPDAVRRIVRPWLLLQDARGYSLDLEPRDGPGDEAIRIKLRGLDAPALSLRVTARLTGGFHVWLDQPLVLASLYGRERDAALAKSAAR